MTISRYFSDTAELPEPQEGQMQVPFSSPMHLSVKKLIYAMSAFQKQIKTQDIWTRWRQHTHTARQPWTHCAFGSQMTALPDHIWQEDMKGIGGHYKAKVTDSPDKTEINMGHWSSDKKHSHQLSAELTRNTWILGTFCAKWYFVLKRSVKNKPH